MGARTEPTRSSETGGVTLVRLAGHMCDARLWRGLGEGAGHAPVDADLTADSTIEAMAARALAACKGPLIPIGLSMGGIVALEMARQAPRRIAALAVLDTNPGADLPERAAVRPARHARAMAGGLREIVVDELRPHYLAEANRSEPALNALLLDMALDLGPEVLVRQSEALRTRSDLTPVLGALDAPVFVACGAEDRLCLPDWHVAMAAAARRSVLHVIPGAGHMLPLEQPRALAAAFDVWLSTIRQEARVA